MSELITGGDALQRAQAQADRCRQTVCDLQRQINQTRKTLADAVRDNQLAQARLDELLYRQRRESAMPLSEAYKPSAYVPEVRP